MILSRGGRAWLWGACVVAGGAWLQEGMHGCGGEGACVVAGGCVVAGYDEIRSMSGRYASYWNVFL